MALPIPQEAENELMNVQTRLKGSLERLQFRLVPRAALHITLCFLGNVQESLIPSLSERLAQIAAKHPPAQLRLGKITSASGDAISRNLVCSVEAGQSLMTLQKALCLACAECGIQVNDKGIYRPHVTIARNRNGVNISKFVSDKVDQITWSASEFNLYRSVQGPDGSRYTVLASFRLSS